MPAASADSGLVGGSRGSLPFARSSPGRSGDCRSAAAGCSPRSVLPRQDSSPCHTRYSSAASRCRRCCYCLSAGCSRMCAAPRRSAGGGGDALARAAAGDRPADAAVSAAGRRARPRQPGTAIAAGPVAAADAAAGRASRGHADAAPRHDRPAGVACKPTTISSAIARTAMAASISTQSQAEIRANNSLLRNLTITNMPGISVRQDGDVIRVELPADQLFNPGTAQLKYGAEATAAQRRGRSGAELSAADDRHRRPHRRHAHRPRRSIRPISTWRWPRPWPCTTR